MRRFFRRWRGLLGCVVLVGSVAAWDVTGADALLGLAGIAGVVAVGDALSRLWRTLTEGE